MVPRYWMFASWALLAVCAILALLLLTAAAGDDDGPETDRVVGVRGECYRGNARGYEDCGDPFTPDRYWLTVRTPDGNTYEVQSPSARAVGDPWP